AGRRRVAAIEEAMNRDAWHVVRNEGPDGGEQMLIDGMHATRAEQSHDVEGATGGAHVAGQGSEGWERGELAPADTLIDAHEVLRHHSTRTEVQVTDFTVPHLACRESDGQATGIEKCARSARDETIPDRSAGHRDRIAFT